MKIKLRHVERFKDRHGKVRWYFRRGKGARVALPGEPGSPEFMAAYGPLLAGAVVARPLSTAETFDHLLRRYFASVGYRNLAESSRRAYRRAIERIVADEKIGHRLVREMKRDHVRRMIEKREAKPASAYDCLKKIRLLLSFAVDLGWRDDNPALRLETFDLGEYHTWTEAEIELYEARWPIGSRERAAFALLLYTGQRGSDVRVMTWADLSPGEARIQVSQQKTGTKLWIPLHRQLTAALDGLPREAAAIVPTRTGDSFSEKGFGQWLADRFDDAGLPDRCVVHGLRKAAARRLAEAGCTEKEIAAITGHKSLREVQRYTQAADQIKLAEAAIGKISQKPQTPTPNTPNPGKKTSKIKSKRRGLEASSGIEPEYTDLQSAA